MLGAKTPESPEQRIVLLIHQCLDTLNHAINPLLYTVSGSLYRQEMLKLFKPKFLIKLVGNKIDEVLDLSSSYRKGLSDQEAPGQGNVNSGQSGVNGEQGNVNSRQGRGNGEQSRWAK